MKKRLVGIEVMPEVFRHIFTEGLEHSFKTIKGIPADAEFRGFCHSYERNCVIVFFEHETFPEVNQGEYIPHIECQFTKLKISAETLELKTILKHHNLYAYHVFTEKFNTRVRELTKEITDDDVSEYMLKTFGNGYE